MKSKLAIWSAFFGLLPTALWLAFLLLGHFTGNGLELAFFFVFFGGLPFILVSFVLGIILGIFALRNISRNSALSGKWLAWIGVFSPILLVVFVWLVFTFFL